MIKYKFETHLYSGKKIREAVSMSYTQQKEIETISLLSFCDLLIDTREIKRRKLDRQTDLHRRQTKLRGFHFRFQKRFCRNERGRYLCGRERLRIFAAPVYEAIIFFRPGDYGYHESGVQIVS